MKTTAHAQAFSSLQTNHTDKGVYQLAHPFQLDVRGIVGVSLNIRRVMADQLDIEIGSDLAILNGLDTAHPKQFLPLARSRIITHPATGQTLMALSYPVAVGFVPFGATLSDGSPHPHGGTGFGISHVNAVPCTSDGALIGQGLTARIEGKGVGMVELLQLSYNGCEFRIDSRNLLDFNDLIPGWRFVGMPLGGFVSEGADGLLGGICAAPADDPNALGRAGLVRWKRVEGAWRAVEFVPVGPLASYEPSVVRDTDGSLLMTVRGCHEYSAPGNAEALAEAANMNHIRVWRSTDNGASWSLIINEKGKRVCTTVCMGMTAGGRPFVAGGPYCAKDRMGREIGKDGHSDWMRESIVMWPLSDDRSRTLDAVVVRDPRVEFPPPMEGSTWWVDHPITALLTLDDGRPHAVITYRVADYLELMGKASPTPLTGSYMEEILD